MENTIKNKMNKNKKKVKINLQRIIIIIIFFIPAALCWWAKRK